MAFNGSGTYVRSHSWTTDKTNTVPVTASRMDTECDGYATGLSLTLCKDGQQTATARIPFALGTSSMDGTVASASYAHISDLNTGLYFPAADQWGLTAGGVGTLTSTATVVTCPVVLNITGASTITGAFIASATANIVGNFSVATNKFNVTAATGNTAIAGTANVVGDFSVATNKFNVAAASGDTLVAGTLGVTGASSLAAVTASSSVTANSLVSTTSISGATVVGAMVASQAEQETGTATDKLVTPGRQHFHPGAAKAWGKFAGATGTVAVSYNVTGVVHDSTGDWTVTIGNDFSTADYIISVSALNAVTTCLRIPSQAAGTFTIKAQDPDGVDIDPTAIFFVCYGDL